MTEINLTKKQTRLYQLMYSTLNNYLMERNNTGFDYINMKANMTESEKELARWLYGELWARAFRRTTDKQKGVVRYTKKQIAKRWREKMKREYQHAIPMYHCLIDLIKRENNEVTNSMKNHAQQRYGNFWKASLAFNKFTKEIQNAKNS